MSAEELAARVELLSKVCDRLIERLEALEGHVDSVASLQALIVTELGREKPNPRTVARDLLRERGCIP